MEEAKNYLHPEEEALSVDDLDAVAGGKIECGITPYPVTCFSAEANFAVKPPTID